MAKRKKKGKAKKSNGISDLIKELWQAAVNLRGSIEPADYKRYVLPLIFLRFISIRFEERRKELEYLIQKDVAGMKKAMCKTVSCQPKSEATRAMKYDTIGGFLFITDMGINMPFQFTSKP